MSLKFAVVLAALTACSSSSDKTDIGDTTVGANTFHVFREGPAAAAGVMTTFVMKPTSGDMPSSIVGWIGTPAEVDDSAQVTGEFDAHDGDYDFDMTCPTNFNPASKFWFAVDTDNTTVVGSIDLK